MTVASPNKVAPIRAPCPAAAEPAGLLARPGGRFAFFALLLCLCFCVPLYGLVRYAVKSDLYSHVLIIPFITLYLVRLRLRAEKGLGERAEDGGGAEPRTLNLELRTLNSELGTRGAGEGSGTRWNASLPGLVAVGLVVGYGVMRWRGWQPGPEDDLCVTMLAFVLFLVAGGLAILGGRFMKGVAFPVTMLFFMVPFPSVVKNGIETFFQHTSAEAAWGLFSLSGMPFLRDGLVFQLPGMSIRVAEECSGIRSSLVLFITALLAGCLFLSSPWKRAVLALVVIPLGIVRNGFRIFVIGMLCAQVGPEMINSPLHHRGGPVFFLLSLIPFFLILWWLRRSDHRGQRTTVREHLED